MIIIIASIVTEMMIVRFTFLHLIKKGPHFY